MTEESDSFIVVEDLDEYKYISLKKICDLRTLDEIIGLLGDKNSRLFYNSDYFSEIIRDKHFFTENEDLIKVESKSSMPLYTLTLRPISYENKIQFNIKPEIEEINDQDTFPIFVENCSFLPLNCNFLLEIILKAYDLELKDPSIKINDVEIPFGDFMVDYYETAKENHIYLNGVYTDKSWGIISARVKTLEEIYESYDNFKNDIQILIEDYQTKITEKKLLCKEDISTIFDIIIKINEMCGNIDLQDLKPSYNTKISSFIKEFLSHCIVFKEYFKLYPKIFQILVSLRKHERHYFTVQNIHDKDFYKLIQSPLMTFRRMLFMLDKILCATPKSHKDYHILNRYKKKSTEILECKRLIADLAQINLLLSTQLSMDNEFLFFKSGRSFIYSSPVKIMREEQKYFNGFLMLFSDVILLFRKNERNLSLLFDCSVSHFDHINEYPDELSITLYSREKRYLDTSELKIVIQFFSNIHKNMWFDHYYSTLKLLSIKSGINGYLFNYEVVCMCKVISESFKETKVALVGSSAYLFNVRNSPMYVYYINLEKFGTKLIYVKQLKYKIFSVINVNDALYGVCSKGIFTFSIYTNNLDVIFEFTDSFQCVESSSINEHNGNIYIFGGIRNGSKTNDLYIYNIDKNEIRKSLATSGPSPRVDHSACISNGIIYVFGGNSDLSNNDAMIHCYNIHKDIWEKSISINGLQFRKFHGAVVINNHLILYNGLCSEPIQVINLSNNKLEQSYAYGTIHDNLSGFSSVIYKDCIYVFTGFDDLCSNIIKISLPNEMCRCSTPKRKSPDSSNEFTPYIPLYPAKNNGILFTRRSKSVDKFRKSIVRNKGGEIKGKIEYFDPIVHDFMKEDISKVILNPCRPIKLFDMKEIEFPKDAILLNDNALQEAKSKEEKVKIEEQMAENIRLDNIRKENIEKLLQSAEEQVSRRRKLYAAAKQKELDYIYNPNFVFREKAFEVVNDIVQDSINETIKHFALLNENNIELLVKTATEVVDNLLKENKVTPLVAETIINRLKQTNNNLIELKNNIDENYGSIRVFRVNIPKIRRNIEEQTMINLTSSLPHSVLEETLHNIEEIYRDEQNIACLAAVEVVRGILCNTNKNISILTAERVANALHDQITEVFEELIKKVAEENISNINKIKNVIVPQIVEKHVTLASEDSMITTIIHTSLGDAMSSVFNLLDVNAIHQYSKDVTKEAIINQINLAQVELEKDSEILSPTMLENVRNEVTNALDCVSPVNEKDKSILGSSLMSNLFPIALCEFHSSYKSKSKENLIEESVNRVIEDLHNKNQNPINSIVHRSLPYINLEYSTKPFEKEVASLIVASIMSSNMLMDEKLNLTDMLKIVQKDLNNFLDNIYDKQKIFAPQNSANIIQEINIMLDNYNDRHTIDKLPRKKLNRAIARVLSAYNSELIEHDHVNQSLNLYLKIGDYETSVKKSLDAAELDVVRDVVNKNLRSKHVYSYLSNLPDDILETTSQLAHYLLNQNIQSNTDHFDLIYSLNNKLENSIVNSLIIAVTKVLDKVTMGDGSIKSVNMEDIAKVLETNKDAEMVVDYPGANFGALLYSIACNNCDEPTKKRPEQLVKDIINSINDLKLVDINSSADMNSNHADLSEVCDVLISKKNCETRNIILSNQFTSLNKAVVEDICNIVRNEIEKSENIDDFIEKVIIISINKDISQIVANSVSTIKDSQNQRNLQDNINKALKLLSDSPLVSIINDVIDSDSDTLDDVSRIMVEALINKIGTQKVENGAITIGKEDINEILKDSMKQMGYYMIDKKLYSDLCRIYGNIIGRYIIEDPITSSLDIELIIDEALKVLCNSEVGKELILYLVYRNDEDKFDIPFIVTKDSIGEIKDSSKIQIARSNLVTIVDNFLSTREHTNTIANSNVMEYLFAQVNKLINDENQRLRLTDALKNSLTTAFEFISNNKPQHMVVNAPDNISDLIKYGGPIEKSDFVEVFKKKILSLRHKIFYNSKGLIDITYCFLTFLEDSRVDTRLLDSENVCEKLLEMSLDKIRSLILSVEFNSVTDPFLFVMESLFEDQYLTEVELSNASPIDLLYISFVTMNSSINSYNEVECTILNALSIASLNQALNVFSQIIAPNNLIGIGSNSSIIRRFIDEKILNSRTTKSEYLNKSIGSRLVNDTVLYTSLFALKSALQFKIILKDTVSAVINRSMYSIEFSECYKISGSIIDTIIKEYYSSFDDNLISPRVCKRMCKIIGRSLFNIIITNNIDSPDEINRISHAAVDVISRKAKDLQTNIADDLLATISNQNIETPWRIDISKLDDMKYSNLLNNFILPEVKNHKELLNLLDKDLIYGALNNMPDNNDDLIDFVRKLSLDAANINTDEIIDVVKKLQLDLKKPDILENKKCNFICYFLSFIGKHNSEKSNKHTSNSLVNDVISILVDTFDELYIENLVSEDQRFESALVKKVFDKVNAAIDSDNMNCYQGEAIIVAAKSALQIVNNGCVYYHSNENHSVLQLVALSFLANQSLSYTNNDNQAAILDSISQFSIDIILDMMSCKKPEELDIILSANFYTSFGNILPEYINRLSSIIKSFALLGSLTEKIEYDKVNIIKMAQQEVEFIVHRAICNVSSEQTLSVKKILKQASIIAMLLKPENKESIIAVLEEMNKDSTKLHNNDEKNLLEVDTVQHIFSEISDSIQEYIRKDTSQEDEIIKDIVDVISKSLQCSLHMDDVSVPQRLVITLGDRYISMLQRPTKQNDNIIGIEGHSEGISFSNNNIRLNIDEVLKNSVIRSVLDSNISETEVLLRNSQFQKQHSKEFNMQREIDYFSNIFIHTAMATLISMSGDTNSTSKQKIVRMCVDNITTIINSGEKIISEDLTFHYIQEAAVIASCPSNIISARSIIDNIIIPSYDDLIKHISSESMSEIEDYEMEKQAFRAIISELGRLLSRKDYSLTITRCANELTLVILKYNHMKITRHDFKEVKREIAVKIADSLTSSLRSYLDLCSFINTEYLNLVNYSIDKTLNELKVKVDKVSDVTVIEKSVYKALVTILLKVISDYMLKYSDTSSNSVDMVFSLLIQHIHKQNTYHKDLESYSNLFALLSIEPSDSKILVLRRDEIRDEYNDRSLLELKTEFFHIVDYMKSVLKIAESSELYNLFIKAKEKLSTDVFRCEILDDICCILYKVIQHSQVELISVDSVEKLQDFINHKARNINLPLFSERQILNILNANRQYHDFDPNNISMILDLVLFIFDGIDKSDIDTLPELVGGLYRKSAIKYINNIINDNLYFLYPEKDSLVLDTLTDLIIIDDFSHVNINIEYLTSVALLAHELVYLIDDPNLRFALYSLAKYFQRRAYIEMLKISHISDSQNQFVDLDKPHETAEIIYGVSTQIVKDYLKSKIKVKYISQKYVNSVVECEVNNIMSETLKHYEDFDRSRRLKEMIKSLVRSSIFYAIKNNPSAIKEIASSVRKSLNYISEINDPLKVHNASQDLIYDLIFNHPKNGIILRENVKDENFDIIIADSTKFIKEIIINRNDIERLEIPKSFTNVVITDLVDRNKNNKRESGESPILQELMIDNLIGDVLLSKDAKQNSSLVSEYGVNNRDTSISDHKLSAVNEISSAISIATMASVIQKQLIISDDKSGKDDRSKKSIFTDLASDKGSELASDIKDIAIMRVTYLLKEANSDFNEDVIRENVIKSIESIEICDEKVNLNELAEQVMKSVLPITLSMMNEKENHIGWRLVKGKVMDVVNEIIQADPERKSTKFNILLDNLISVISVDSYSERGNMASTIISNLEIVSTQNPNLRELMCLAEDTVQYAFKQMIEKQLNYMASVINDINGTYAIAAQNALQIIVSENIKIDRYSSDDDKEYRPNSELQNNIISSILREFRDINLHNYVLREALEDVLNSYGYKVLEGVIYITTFRLISESCLKIMNLQDESEIDPLARDIIEILEGKKDNIFCKEVLHTLVNQDSDIQLIFPLKVPGDIAYVSGNYANSHDIAVNIAKKVLRESFTKYNARKRILKSDIISISISEALNRINDNVYHNTINSIAKRILTDVSNYLDPGNDYTILDGIISHLEVSHQNPLLTRKDDIMQYINDVLVNHFDEIARKSSNNSHDVLMLVIDRITAIVCSLDLSLARENQDQVGSLIAQKTFNMILEILDSDKPRFKGPINETMSVISTILCQNNSTYLDDMNGVDLVSLAIVSTDLMLSAVDDTEVKSILKILSKVAIEGALESYIDILMSSINPESKITEIIIDIANCTQCLCLSDQTVTSLTNETLSGLSISMLRDRIEAQNITEGSLDLISRSVTKQVSDNCVQVIKDMRAASSLKSICKDALLSAKELSKHVCGSISAEGVTSIAEQTKKMIDYENNPNKIQQITHNSLAKILTLNGNDVIERLVPDENLATNSQEAKNEIIKAVISMNETGDIIEIIQDAHNLFVRDFVYRVKRSSKKVKLNKRKDYIIDELVNSNVDNEISLPSQHNLLQGALYQKRRRVTDFWTLPTYRARYAFVSVNKDTSDDGRIFPNSPLQLPRRFSPHSVSISGSFHSSSEMHYNRMHHSKHLRRSRRLTFSNRKYYHLNHDNEKVEMTKSKRGTDFGTSRSSYLHSAYKSSQGSVFTTVSCDFRSADNISRSSYVDSPGTGVYIKPDRSLKSHECNQYNEPPDSASSCLNSPILTNELDTSLPPPHYTGDENSSCSGGMFSTESEQFTRSGFKGVCDVNVRGEVQLRHCDETETSFENDLKHSVPFRHDNISQLEEEEDASADENNYLNGIADNLFAAIVIENFNKASTSDKRDVDTDGTLRRVVPATVTAVILKYVANNTKDRLQKEILETICDSTINEIGCNIRELGQVVDDLKLIEQLDDAVELLRKNDVDRETLEVSKQILRSLLAVAMINKKFDSFNQTLVKEECSIINYTQHNKENTENLVVSLFNPDLTDQDKIDLIDVFTGNLIDLIESKTKEEMSEMVARAILMNIRIASDSNFEKIESNKAANEALTSIIVATVQESINNFANIISDVNNGLNILSHESIMKAMNCVTDSLINEEENQRKLEEKEKISEKTKVAINLLLNSFTNDQSMRNYDVITFITSIISGMLKSSILFLYKKEDSTDSIFGVLGAYTNKVKSYDGFQEIISKVFTDRFRNSLEFSIVNGVNVDIQTNDLEGSVRSQFETLSTLLAQELTEKLITGIVGVIHEFMIDKINSPPNSPLLEHAEIPPKQELILQFCERFGDEGCGMDSNSLSYRFISELAEFYSLDTMDLSPGDNLYTIATKTLTCTLKESITAYLNQTDNKSQKVADKAVDVFEHVFDNLSNEQELREIINQYVVNIINDYDDLSNDIYDGIIESLNKLKELEIERPNDQEIILSQTNKGSTNTSDNLASKTLDGFSKQLQLNYECIKPGDEDSDKVSKILTVIIKETVKQYVSYDHCKKIQDISSELIESISTRSISDIRTKESKKSLEFLIDLAESMIPGLIKQYSVHIDKEFCRFVDQILSSINIVILEKSLEQDKFIRARLFYISPYITRITYYGYYFTNEEDIRNRTLRIFNSAQDIQSSINQKNIEQYYNKSDEEIYNYLYNSINNIHDHEVNHVVQKVCNTIRGALYDKHSYQSTLSYENAFIKYKTSLSEQHEEIISEIRGIYETIIDDYVNHQ